MPKFNRSLLISVICLMGIVLCNWVGSAQTPQPSVRLTTTPDISQIRPFEAEATVSQSPVQLAFQAVDAAGQPLKNAKMHLQILTHPKNSWLTTDFPIVEGTTLLNLEILAPEGLLQVQQMLPIRGTYKLFVNVTPNTPNAFPPIQQTLTLLVPENWGKLQNFVILAIILLLAGLGGGWIIGTRQPIRPGEIAPQRVRLLLSGAIVAAIAALLYVNVSAEMAESHHAMVMSHSTGASPAATAPSQRQAYGLDVQLLGDSSAVVGELANFQVSVVDAKTQQPITDVRLKVKATQLENGWISFSYDGITNATGKLQWQEQFFDGAPHQIDVEVAPQLNSVRQFQPFQVTQTLDVEGIAPPLHVRLISLIYMTGVMAIGFLLGLWLQQKRRYHIA